MNPMANSAKKTFLLCVLVAVVILGVGCKEIQQHTELHDTTVQLNCTNKHNRTLTGVTSYQWILPSGIVLSEPSETLALPMSGNSTLMAKDRLYLLENGAVLQINRLDNEDFGLYICLILRNESGMVTVNRVIRHGVNLDGPYYGDQWAKYQPNIKIGLIAGVAMLFFTGLLCCNLEGASTRYDRKLRREGKTSSKSGSNQHAQRQGSEMVQFYSNNGFVLDDGIDGVSPEPNVDEMKEKPQTKL